MNNQIRGRHLFHAFFEYLFVAILIIDCRSIWYHLNSTPQYKGAYLCVLLGVAVLGGIMSAGKVLLSSIRKAWLAVVFLFCFFLLYMAITRLNYVSVLRLAAGFMLVVLYYVVCRENQGALGVLVKYKNLICIVACVSLFFWLFGSILNWILPSGSAYTTWITRNWLTKIPNYYYLYYNTQSITRFGITFARNTAIFTEAPMASLHFTFALGIEFLLVQERRKWRCVVLTLAILSTVSTTGYISLMLIYIGYLILEGGKRGVSARTIRIIAVPFLLVVGGGIVYQLFMSKMSTGSGIDRASDYAVGFSAWLRKPFFGWGYNDDEISTGFSNSVTRILYNGGIYLMLPYLFCFGRGLLRGVRTRNNRFFLFTLLVLFAFIVTICCYQYLTVLLLCYLADNQEVAMQKARQMGCSK